MNKGADIEVESTPVIDLNRHGLVNAANSGEDDVEMPGEWDNEKTEVYTDSDEDGNAMLVDADGEQYTITAFPFVLGRGTECDFVLTGKGVSRKHAEIIFQSGRFVVNDLNSLNGIKVNGYKVSRVILEEGDVIKLGDVALTFSHGSDQPPAPAAKPRKNSLFNKTNADNSLPEDNTFGPSSGKKAIKLLALGVTTIIVLGGGWVAFQQFTNAQRAQQQIVVAPSSSQANAPKAEDSNKNEQSSGSVAQEEVDRQEPVATAAGAPPPSIAMAPISNNKPSVRSIEPELTPSPAKSPAPSKPEAPKATSAPEPQVNKIQQAAARLLASAESEFLKGDAPQLFTNMTKYENNSRVFAGTKSKMKSKHEELARLYALYERGQKAFVSGDKQGAFVAWSSFLERESQVFGKKKSVYADQVTTRVVEEYVERGNKAAQDGKNHDAYRMWEKALDVGESVAARIAIDNVNTKSRQLYRKALRLEYVNSNKARELWNEVVDLVPPGTEYHTKASSKLAWYDRWGA